MVHTPQIVQDFSRKEKRTLLLLSLVLEAFLVFLAVLLPAPLLALAGPALLAFWLLWLLRHVLPGFCRQIEALEHSRRERLEAEYAQPHPTYKLYQGELHLLADCLVCRSRRSMFVLPLEEISYLQRIGHQHSATLVKDLLIKTKGGKTRHLELIGPQGRAMEEIIGMVVTRRRELGIPPEPAAVSTVEPQSEE